MLTPRQTKRLPTILQICFTTYLTHSHLKNIVKFYGKLCHKKYVKNLSKYKILRNFGSKIIDVTYHNN